MNISVNQYLRHNVGYKKYKLFDVTKFILVLPTFRLIQQSLSRTRCLMKSLHSVSKVTLKWNQTKSHARRIKSAKYKTQVIKEQLQNEWATTKRINLTAYHIMKLCSLAIKKFQQDLRNLQNQVCDCRIKGVF